MKTDTEKLAELLYVTMVTRMGIHARWVDQSDHIRKNWQAVAEAAREWNRAQRT